MTTGPRPVALVTGAAGYLGGHVVEELAGAFRVRALVRGPAPWLDDAEVVHADLVHDDLGPACDGASVVVHLGGVDEVRFACDPDTAYAATVQATERVTAAAASSGAARVVYLSTVHVYGGALASGGQVTEDTAPAPTAPYAAARLASERIVQEGRAAAVVLRLTNAVGPPVTGAVRRWTLVANDLCRQAAVTGELRLRTAGTQWRDFIGMDDVRRAVGVAASGGPPAIYNVASGQPRTVLDLARLVQDGCERRTGTRPPLHAPEPDGPPPLPCTVENGRLTATGWAAQQPLADAVQRTVDACLEWKELLA